MLSIGANGQRIAYGIKHYNLDDEADLEILKAKTEQVMGTTAFVIETSKYYMLNGKNKWVEISPFGKVLSDSDSDDDDSDDIIYEGGTI